MAGTYLLETLSAVTYHPSSLACLVFVSLAALYWFALPRPFAGIPYNKAAQWSPLGDVTLLTAYTAEHGETSPWFVEQCLRLNSPIVQVFLGMLVISLSNPC